MPVVSPPSPTIGPGRTRAERLALLEPLLARRILVLDGAMGTMIQTYRLGEADYRGERFADWPRDLQGQQRPADADPAGRSSAPSTPPTSTPARTSSRPTPSPRPPCPMADYGMEDLVYELNHAGAALAREAADEFEARDPEAPRYVAGVLGPTNRTASLSPDVNDPGFRNITFDELAATYADAARGLLDGGADLLLVETIFDTLNAKAAHLRGRVGVRGARLPAAGHDLRHHHRRRAAARSRARPPRRSGTRSRTRDRSASGSTARSAPAALRPYVQELSRVAPVLVSTHPNAGLPNEFGGYDETPEYMAAVLREFAEHGLVNLVGGCCGTTPAHIRAIADAVRDLAPRRPADSAVTAPAHRPRAAHDRPRDALRERGRADQRDRVAQVRAADPRRGVRRRRWRSRASRSRAAPR